MLGDGYAAAERIALEPNGNPNYLPFGKVYGIAMGNSSQNLGKI